MVSFDVDAESLFTNIPLDECIDLAVGTSDSFVLPLLKHISSSWVHFMIKLMVCQLVHPLHMF